MNNSYTLRNFKISIIIGSALLITMALLHGSGFEYVVDEMNESNAPSFLKEIMPVLFLQPSVHLLGLASFGGITIFLREKARPILVLVAIFIGINLVFAIYLKAYFPGAILLLSLGCFLLAMHYQRTQG